MINGAHVIVYSKDAEGLDAWFKDVLELPSVDVGDGWLIFALPPAEVAAHPTEEANHHELFLMCDDVHATVERLTEKGVEFSAPITDRGWGLLTSIRIPGGGEIGLYEPRHASPRWVGAAQKGSP
ncbi:MAG: VOC family protein [Candidatus Dormibacteraeota bacterium]|uniref:VOC family protein n=1 Tax=Candidatus Amunia macphersoniae TaxID=3127014 RepID=A0A934KLE8_9BACT|nr:VOC family protein [Candidatus Dormibacteraeota bacterium]